jgi:DNA-directed RNA polymerase subunit F
MNNILNLKNIKDFEKITEDEAKKIFNDLCKLNDDQKQIDLNFIRRLLAINNNNYSKIFLKFLTQYKLIDEMRKGKFNKESLHNVVFNEEEFVNFLTGKDTKELIFEDNSDLNQKRFKIEDYAKLYELIGGNQNGINKDDLKKNIEEVLKLLNQNEDEGKLSQIAEEQAKEVIELLGSNEDSLTPEDFMNIMTSNTMMPENLEETL